MIPRLVQWLKDVRWWWSWWRKAKREWSPELWDEAERAIRRLQEGRRETDEEWAARLAKQVHDAGD